MDVQVPFMSPGLRFRRLEPEGQSRGVFQSMAAATDVLNSLRIAGAGRPVGLEDLARRATAGERDAFEELVRRLQRRVFGLAYQHVRDAGEAEDLAQEIFVRLYRQLD